MNCKTLLTLTASTLFAFSSISFGQAPNLGTAASFALFTANGAFTNSGASLVTGDIGTNVGAFTGFPSPGTVVGNIRLPASPEAAQAAIDVVAAYNSLTPAVCGTTIPAELSSLTLTAGVSCQNSADPTTLNGTLTLSGPGIFIIKLNSALTTATNSTILLTDGATASNVFFRVNGAATLGTGSVFKGTILAMGAIVLATQASLEGRGLSTAGAITLNNNNVTVTGDVLLPDLTPSQLFSSSQISEGQTIDVLVSIRNVGESPTSGEVQFFVTNYTPATGLTMIINPDPTATIGGDTYALNTADFTISSNNFAFTFTSVAGPSGVIANGGNKLIAFRLTRSVGSSKGTVTNTITIPDGTGGGETPTNNNTLSNTFLKP
ncbi:ice-binding family protein [Spirosoma endbachense]|uniref:DUF3494 domain-containing protein n=1 Tax=Spirosoma endbachense TaxID=2666025 RepID=A0A6P1W5L3_9BACT|nr:ice-binding family protein [Spirosoma endbachense]QHV99319.1 DUF3494 domain-containing protein [Spirosoma endbachense]